MKIGILVLMAGRNAGGPETYEVQLLRALVQIDTVNQYIVYCTTASAIDAIGVSAANVRYRVLKPSIRLVSVSASLPLALRQDGVDLLHATFTPPPFTPIPLVFTMHCMSNFVHPEFYPRLIAWRLNALQRIGIRSAAHILCVSKTLKQEVNEYFGRPLSDMTVTYNAVGPEFRPTPISEAQSEVRERFGIECPYILYTGKIQARKNLARLVYAFAQFRRRTDSPLKLVLAGRRTETAEVLDTALADSGIAHAVVELGYVPHANLPSLYSAARMFVFPSLWEGFGIPLLEAMACGVPSIISNATCLPEIAAGAAVIVNPESIDSMCEAMINLDTGQALRADLSQKGLVRSRDFTWRECAERTLAAYIAVGHQRRLAASR